MTLREMVPLEGPGIAPISAAVRFGNLLFASGIAAIDTTTGRLLAEDIDGQCDAIFAALGGLIDRCGGSLADVLRVECFLSDPAYFGAWNAAFARSFPRDPPARTTLVCGFALPGLLVEVQAVCGLTG